MPVSKKRYKIAWFVPPHKNKLKDLMGISPWNPNHSAASVWIRGYQIAKYLNPNKFQATCNKFQSFPDIAIFLRRYNHDDVQLAKYLKTRGCKIILDVVTNYFEVRHGDRYGVGTSSSRRVENIRKLLKIADQVWTVSPFLQEIASQYHDNVHFISDSIDINHFKSDNLPNYQRPMILGWSGIFTKSYALETIKPVLIPLIYNGDIELIIFSNRRPDLSLPYKFKRWNYKRFPHQISRCDLGIAPRTVDNNYDRGHSIFKIGVFMAMGKPVIAGPVPSYQLLLKGTDAGVICRSIKEWKSQIEIYLNNPKKIIEASPIVKKNVSEFATPVIIEQITELFLELLSS